MAIILSKWGFLFIIRFHAVFIYELYALIIEIKYGKEDDEIASAPSVTDKISKTKGHINASFLFGQ